MYKPRVLFNTVSKYENHVTYVIKNIFWCISDMVLKLLCSLFKMKTFNHSTNNPKIKRYAQSYNSWYLLLRANSDLKHELCVAFWYQYKNKYSFKWQWWSGTSTSTFWTTLVWSFLVSSPTFVVSSTSTSPSTPYRWIGARIGAGRYSRFGWRTGIR